MVERAGRVEGKIAIVAGAGAMPGPGLGIGKATSIALAREGARVVLVDLHRERAEDTQRIIEDEGGTAIVFAGDMTKAGDCEAMVETAVREFGTVDILVNNIGGQIVASVPEISEEEWDRGLDLNLRTAFLASKYALPVMLEQRHGSIVNVSSISAMRAGGAVVYTTAKGALISMTLDMAYCHGREGVRVNAVVPGHVYTPMTADYYGGPGPRLDYITELRGAASFLGTVGKAWDVAAAVTFLASDEAAFITGVALPVDGGMLGAMPVVMSRYMLQVPMPSQ